MPKLPNDTFPSSEVIVLPPLLGRAGRTKDRHPLEPISVHTNDATVSVGDIADLKPIKAWGSPCRDDGDVIVTNGIALWVHAVMREDDDQEPATPVVRLLLKAGAGYSSEEIVYFDFHPNDWGKMAHGLLVRITGLQASQWELWGINPSPNVALDLSLHAFFPVAVGGGTSGLVLGAQCSLVTNPLNLPLI